MKSPTRLLRIAWVFGLSILLGCAAPGANVQMPDHFEQGAYQIISFSRDEETRVMRALLLLDPAGFGLEMLGDFDMPLTVLRFDAKGLRIQDNSGAFPKPLAELIARDIFLTYYGGGLPLKSGFSSRFVRDTRIHLAATPGSIQKSIRFSSGNEMEIELALDQGRIVSVSLSSSVPKYQLRIRCLRHLSPRLEQME